VFLPEQNDVLPEQTDNPSENRDALPEVRSNPSNGSEHPAEDRGNWLTVSKEKGGAGIPIRDLS
jgi:hypothetical protein